MCPSRKYLHMDCPGCGMQRSIIALLNGDIAQSLAYHPAAIFVLFLIVFTPLHLLFKFRAGAKIILFSFLSVAGISFIFYIYKIFTHQIFY